MSKVELEAKMDALVDEINFLRAFYEAVREPGSPCSGRPAVGGLSWAQKLLAPSLAFSLIITPSAGYNLWTDAASSTREKIRFSRVAGQKR